MSHHAVMTATTPLSAEFFKAHLCMRSTGDRPVFLQYITAYCLSSSTNFHTGRYCVLNVNLPALFLCPRPRRDFLPAFPPPLAPTPSALHPSIHPGDETPTLTQKEGLRENTVVCSLPRASEQKPGDLQRKGEEGKLGSVALTALLPPIQVGISCLMLISFFLSGIVLYNSSE